MENIHEDMGSYQDQ